MKILVVGAGAIGGYYGARLLQAGADVTFLVRPLRAASLASTGLQVSSELGDFSGAVATVVREDLMPSYDLIVLSCKAYDLDAAMHDFAPAVRPGTVILPFLNGMSVYDQLDARFGRDRVLGGVAYIAVMLGQDRVIRHFGANDVVVIGPRSQATSHAAERFFALISASQGSRKLAPDVTQALWNKWVMLGTGALMTCLMRGTVADILATRDGERLMKQAISECCAVAEAEGHALSSDELSGLKVRLLDTRSTWAASMMRDIAQNAPQLEAQAIVGDLIVRAERNALELPLARTANCHLQVYEGQHARAQPALLIA